MPSGLPKNQLIAALSPATQKAIKPHLSEVDLSIHTVIMKEGDAFDKVYFPISGVISTVGVFSNGVTIEMATTGREGMVGVGAEQSDPELFL
ncbi:MAG TPA: cyclic nucleotide-binding domain-containing protein [Hyphomicrobiales bacterium]|nr:cyclic nucleotide-binding domain-containing protein [Hyphomicrobiales bacterium]